MIHLSKRLRWLATLFIFLVVILYSFRFQNKYINGISLQRIVYSSGQNLSTVTEGNAFDYGRTKIGEIMAERKQRLEEFCRGKELQKAGNNSEQVVKNHFRYDPNHKLVYCAVEKVGCTFWQSVLAELSRQNHGAPVVQFADLSFDATYSILHNSLKFVITREPFARLFSGYANKLFQVNPMYWGVVGKQVIKHFRPNATAKSLRCGHDTTFEELVKFVIFSETKAPGLRDGHFVPLTDHCRPCQIKYDIIAKLETLKDDTLFVFDKLGIPANNSLRVRMADMEKVYEEETLRDAANHLLGPLAQVSDCLSKGEALRRTWRSYQYRGYIGKHVKYPLSEDEEKTINSARLYKMFRWALKESGGREERLKNRQLVLEEAYSKIPLHDLVQLQNIFSAHCDVFGYDCSPGFVFDRKRKVETDFLNWRDA